jgi:hypothetical protein
MIIIYKHKIKGEKYMIKKNVKLVFALAIIGFLGISTQAFSQVIAQDYQALMEKVLVSYQNIGKTLSETSTEGIQHEAEQIVSITQQIMDQKAGLPKEKVSQFNILMKRMNSQSTNLLNNKDIESLRNEYVLLSNAVIGYIHTFEFDKEYYVYACEGDLTPWVQKNKKPQKDPYCDSPCGKIIEEIGRK